MGANGYLHERGLVALNEGKLKEMRQSVIEGKNMDAPK
jgi:hypothetical protein